MENINIKKEIENYRNKHKDFKLLMEETKIINDFIDILNEANEKIPDEELDKVKGAIENIKKELNIQCLKDFEHKEFLKLWIKNHLVY